MDATRQLLFFFSALGSFNGLLVAVYLLFFLRPARLGNRLLGCLLLALSIRTGKSVFIHFNHEQFPLFLQLGLTACIFIGPLLWLYVRSVREDWRRLPGQYWWLLGGLATGMLVVGYLWPYYEYRGIWRTSVMKVIYWTWTAGVAAAAVVLWPVLRRWGKWTTQELWLVNVFAANFLVHVAYRTVSYTSYIVGALSFSCVFYLLGVWYVLRRREADFLVPERPKYGDSKVAPDLATDLLKRCRRVMEKEKLYLRSDLKLVELAQAIDSTPHELSQVLNDRLGQRFTDYLRGYRVRHAQAAILTDDHLTLEAIGREAGFGSKSAFYAAFREVTGMTPAQHRRGRSSAR